MVKAIWAVACAAVVSVALMLTFAACASAPKKAEDPAESTKVASQYPQLESVASTQPPAETASPAPSAPTSATSGEAAVFRISADYRIGPEDILRVSVWENKELTLDVTVRPDGKISLPLIQDVQAEGLTAVELGNVIHQKLKTYIVEPQVSVIVIQVNASKIYVIGNVARPGPYLLRSDMSVLHALSVAGGFTQFASPRGIKLVRGTGAKQEVRKINYFDLIADGGEGNYLLRAGDTIVVP